MGVDRPLFSRRRSLSSMADAGLFLFQMVFLARVSLAIRVAKSFFEAIVARNKTNWQKAKRPSGNQVTQESLTIGWEK